MPIQFTVLEERSQTNPTVIKVIGVGGGGNNAINRMIEGGLTDVEFIAVNTDVQTLGKSKAHNLLPIGKKLTNGLGAGGVPEIGEKAALEDRETIKSALKGADMVFITGGMGGGTGTGAAPIIASISKELGILTVAVVTKPFLLEKERKMRLAEDGIQKLREAADSVIIVPNENLLSIIDKKTPFKKALLFADDVLRQGVQGISDLITKNGDIKIDFADVKTVMNGKGDAVMGIGTASGENRAVDAATDAINNPMLRDANIDGAKGLLLNVTSGPDDFSMAEFEEIMKVITSTSDKEVLVKFGTVTDPNMKDEIRVTVIATGFAVQELGKKEEEIVAAVKNDFVSTKEWNSMTKGRFARKDESYLTSRNSSESNMDIPAVLRLRQNEFAVSGGK